MYQKQCNVFWKSFGYAVVITSVKWRQSHRIRQMFHHRCNFNPFLPNGLSHPYQMSESICKFSSAASDIGLHCLPMSHSTAILPLPLSQEEQLSVTCEGMCTCERMWLVNCLGGLPRNRVARLKVNWPSPKWPKMCWRAVKQKSNQKPMSQK